MPVVTGSCIPCANRHTSLLRQFTQVDYANHVALIAEVFADGRETVIGEARYVCGADPPAEISVSVSEAWQDKGLAKLMLTKLECRTAAAGVSRFIGYTFATNEKMRSLARKVGFSEKPAVRGVVRLEKALATLSMAALGH
jgi:RimJ/RimL family protein N-acetyltransferase